ncbi:hypothetical protein RSSM_02409 [Rhodopirellula sallentina SM41]|uniref:Uncharacterized protein n=1 Tax=Rhodopirellula sallentina SM41 TaxID=1263870 RepID=M5U3Y3_9BACT|nr:hypothetical protein RSSM_02409 [Rhodopirellula sallentina SM41]
MQSDPSFRNRVGSWVGWFGESTLETAIVADWIPAKANLCLAW